MGISTGSTRQLSLFGLDRTWGRGNCTNEEAEKWSTRLRHSMAMRQPPT